jgi:rare lipoprotein A
MKTLTIAMMLLTEISLSANVHQTGIASWYDKENKISSTGKKIKHNSPALAHRTFPIGTWVKITDTNTRKSVVAVVEDRGPYIRGRVVDLNKSAAKKLGILKKGVAKVSVEKLK